MTVDERMLSSLGLCAKAGRLIYGTPMIVEAMQKRKRIYLVVESADTSANTHKRINDKCAFYGVRAVRISADGGELASAVGKSGSLAAVAINDEGFYKMICKYIDAEG